MYKYFLNLFIYFQISFRTERSKFYSQNSFVFNYSTEITRIKNAKFGLIIEPQLFNNLNIKYLNILNYLVPSLACLTGLDFSIIRGACCSVVVVVALII